MHSKKTRISSIFGLILESQMMVLANFFGRVDFYTIFLQSIFGLTWGVTSTFVNQYGSGKVGLGGPDSFSSSSDPFEVVKSLSEDLSNEHIDESVKSIICSCRSPKAGEFKALVLY